MSALAKRLYIFTGKGGVGKTTLSLAMTKYFKAQGKKVRYNSFFVEPDKELCRKLNIDVLDMDLISSAEMYIARKLKSQTIASWIMKTHFFQSLFQMIPGLNHMILLGHIIDELEHDPDLIIVMDSPASGHALTMFEASSNFKKIFSSGLIVKDIDRMHSFLENPDNLGTFIVTLATELAMSEAHDLQAELAANIKGLNLTTNIIINDSFIQYLNDNAIATADLPSFLQDRLKREEALSLENQKLPHVPELKETDIVNKLSEKMKLFI